MGSLMAVRGKSIRPALLFLAGLAGFAQAAKQCSIPDAMPEAPILKQVESRVPVHDLQFVYSWSPFHCKQVKPASANSVASWDQRFQCEDNRFGFVVHGLWPQAKGVTGQEGQPRACKTSAPLAPVVLKQHLCTVPGVRLMQNEWSAHGTCHWDRTEAYFGDIETLARTYPMPTLDRLQGKDVAVDDIVAAVVAGSAGKLRADMVGVRVQQVERLRSLQEIYICLDLKQRPKACASRGTPGQLKAFVWPVQGAPRDRLQSRE
jgi:ribonuclease T2